MQQAPISSTGIQPQTTHQTASIDWNDLMNETLPQPEQAALQIATNNDIRDTLKLLAQSTNALLMNTLAQKSKHAIKSKEMQITKFDGTDVTTYRFFREAVKRTLENAGWAATEKLIYLKECLTGEALNFISFLQLDEESYEMAWQILDLNYDSKRKVVAHIIKQLTNPSYRTKSGDDNALRSF